MFIEKTVPGEVQARDALRAERSRARADPAAAVGADAGELSITNRRGDGVPRAQGLVGPVAQRRTQTPFASASLR